MKIEMYEDSSCEWRWRLRAPNGRILCDSAEGYNSKPGVRRAIANFVKYLCEAVPTEEIRVRSSRAQDAKVKVPVRRPRAEARKAA